MEQPEATGRDLIGPAKRRSDELDAEPHVGAALARVFAAASDLPPAAAGLEAKGQGQEGPQQGEGIGGEEDDGVEVTGEQGTPEGRQGSTGVADRARPKAGEAETCKQWATWWCMFADVCRFARPQPRVPQGLPKALLLVLRTIARVGALRLSRSDRREELLCDVVEAEHGGGLPAVGYAVGNAGRVVWAVALPCGMAALHTPFPGVPWRDTMSLQEASLGWVCTWHTHLAGMHTAVASSGCGDLLVLGDAHG